MQPPEPLFNRLAPWIHHAENVCGVWSCIPVVALNVLSLVVVLDKQLAPRPLPTSTPSSLSWFADQDDGADKDDVFRLRRRDLDFV